MVVPLCAAGFLIWANLVRIQRADYVSSLVTDPPRIDPASPTGYAGGTRALIVPAHYGTSYDWIVQTQHMFSPGDWRVRHVDYDNAPSGRDVHLPSPYRWWLGLIAWLDHVSSGRSLGLSVERAALYADPLLHLFLLASATIFAARHFGAFAATLLSIGITIQFPFAAGFIPGAPDRHGLAQAIVVWSVLLLLAGLRSLQAAVPTPTNSRPHHWFFIAGLVGGFGMWINVASQLPVVAGIALGAIVAAWIGRGDAAVNWNQSRLWRAWALGGAAMCLAGYLIEYFPAHLVHWQLQAIHPLHALAWLGVGELVARSGSWIQGNKPGWNFRNTAVVTLAVAAIAAVPVAMWVTASRGFLAANLFDFRLTKLPDGIAAPNFAAWIRRDGFTAQAWATVLPILAIAPAAWLIARRRTPDHHRIILAVALGPVLVALGFACVYLRWWHLFDAALLALMTAVTAAIGNASYTRKQRSWGAGFTILLLLPGAFLLLPPTGAATRNAIPLLEVDGLIERDLARWLAKRSASEAVVWAPPSLTNTLHYYGGMRGVGTVAGENEKGLVAAIRIARATSAQEAEALIRQRGITHLVLPTWDPYFEDLLRSASEDPKTAFLTGLQRWQLPPWLRPVPYQFSRMAGIEDYSVAIFEVVEEQEDAIALSHLAEYFAEMGQLDFAASVERELQRFPADLGALAARAHVGAARGDAEGGARTIASLRLRLAGGADRFLPWDRRVSLTIALARAREIDLAREQVRRCVTELSEVHLRSLTSGMLLNLQKLFGAFGFEISDPHLRDLARDLLPPELRNQL